jgi:hypothetical protein
LAMNRGVLPIHVVVPMEAEITSELAVASLDVEEAVVLVPVDWQPCKVTPAIAPVSIQSVWRRVHVPRKRLRERSNFGVFIVVVPPTFGK